MRRASCTLMVEMILWEAQARSVAMLLQEARPRGNAFWGLETGPCLFNIPAGLDCGDMN